jgi:hypothetical protein
MSGNFNILEYKKVSYEIKVNISFLHGKEYTKLQLVLKYRAANRMWGAIIEWWQFTHVHLLSPHMRAVTSFI